MACGLTNPLGAPAQTFGAGFAFTFDNSDSTQNATTIENGVMKLRFPGSTGAFVGRYIYAGAPGDSGSIAGMINTDSTIAITQFGDPGQSLGASIVFYQSKWPNCDFTHATGIPFSGISRREVWILTGGVTASCTYTTNGRQVAIPTTVAETVSVQIGEP
jgi:hypothetical protein